MLWIECASGQYKTLHFPVEKQKNMPAQLWAIGHADKRPPHYYKDGTIREEIEWDKQLFQYTVSGMGVLEIEGEKYVLEKGHGFLLKGQGRYKYYIHPESDHWEILYITLYGSEVKEAWDLAEKMLGTVITADETSPLISYMKHAYQMAIRGMLTDAFLASSVAYHFVAELNRLCFGLDNPITSWPQPVLKSIDYMKEHYHDEVSLDDIAAVAGLTKYHFSRLFQKNTGYTPLKYLTKIRIEKAIQLIAYTNKPIQEIAALTGFNNHNYFTRVFRQYVNSVPSQFRKYAERLFWQNEPANSSSMQREHIKNPS